MEDNKKRRVQKTASQKLPEVAFPSKLPSTEVNSQLATICSSLLRNEQTLLQMLQNQMSRNAESTYEDLLSSESRVFE